MNRFEFYKELYFREFDRRDTVNSYFNTQLIIVTAITTGIYVLVTTFSYSVHISLVVFFLFFATGAIICLVRAVLFLAGAYVNMNSIFTRHPGDYGGIGKAEEYLEFERETRAYHVAQNPSSQSIDIDTNSDVETYLIKEFAKHTDKNSSINDSHYDKIYSGKVWLLYSIFLTIMSIIPFCISIINDKLSEKPKHELWTPRVHDVYNIENNHNYIEKKDEQPKPKSKSKSKPECTKPYRSAKDCPKADSASGKAD